MKKTIIAIIATLLFSTSYAQTAKRDTIKTAGIFISLYDGRIFTDYMFKLYKDTSKLTPIGSTGTYKMSTVKDTLYWLPTIYPAVDSLGKPKLDSLGRPLQNFQWMPATPRNVIIDFNKRYN